MNEKEYREKEYYNVPFNIEMRAMGEDLVAVNESESKVSVINKSARIILDGIRNSKTEKEIIDDLKNVYLIGKEIDLEAEITKAKKELIDAGILIERKRKSFEKPSVIVKDLSAALKNLDYQESVISQYE
ncbi:MAG: hypothetical protein HUU08_09460 [Candidatus Brocadia sp.]|nr:hypothetical protein [Candidatus Brocadia sp.]UJS17497.1 MAG: hypothetical protein L3J17_00150 [Candidatus Jettenia sp.]